jgi:hypothetical protein
LRNAFRILDSIKDEPDLIEQTLLRVGLSDKTTKPAGEHPIQLRLLRKPAAEDDGDFGVNPL